MANEIIEYPWNIPYHLACLSLALCDRSDLLLQILEITKSRHIRAIVLRALAHVTVDAQLPRRFWNILTDDSPDLSEKMKASEGLLHCDQWNDASFATCVSLIEHEENPYLVKNYVLILGRAFREQAIEYLATLQVNRPNLVIIDAVQYLLSSDFGNLAFEDEPEILNTYYTLDYPDAESDTREQDDSEPGWLPV